jgi:hypothetical protein
MHLDHSIIFYREACRQKAAQKQPIRGIARARCETLFLDYSPLQFHDLMPGVPADQPHADGHPTGVLPVGSACFEDLHSHVRCQGLGYLDALDDALICRILEECSASDLVLFSAVSKAAYCFANNEDLWRALVLNVRSLQTSALRCSVTRNSGSFTRGSRLPQSPRSLKKYLDVRNSCN